jgi:catechol 2,3-dioxygenase-like lactoylglutathione lyase family enzyme
VTIRGLDHVQLAAPPGCEAQARRFFGELLGMPELPKPEPMRASGGAWFQAGDRELHVGVERDFAPATKAHPALSVAEEELEALAGRLAGAGHPVEWDGRYPGRPRFYTRDPWGNRIELLALR